MREIVFRAWDIDKQKYITYFEMSCDGCVTTQEPNCSPDYPNVILEQYTGLKDKNGVEIYEGDIVRITDDQITTIMGETIQKRSIEKAQVYWDDDGLSWCYKDVEENETEMARLKGGSDSWRIWELECEVIGNIHENPELVKGEE